MNSENRHFEEHPVSDSKGHIFVVDDDNTIRRIIINELKKYGYSVLSAANGKMALESFIEIEKKKKTIDLILLDLVMPELSGIEVFNGLKNINRFKEVPVIFITGSDSIEDKKAALQMGAVDYISKMPKIYFEILFPKIDTFVKMKKLSDEVNLKNELLNDINKKLDQKVKERTSELNKANIELDITNYISILGFANAAEYYDEFTSRHLKRIPLYLDVLVRYFMEDPKCIHRKKDIECLNKDLYDHLSASSVLHDIGKLGIDSGILKKPGKLSPDELKIMKTHTVIGKKWLTFMYDEYTKHFNKKNIYYLASEIAYTHHERWDGTGYPNRLKYEEIPLSGRLVALVDAYDTMISQRPYKDPKSHEDVVKMINEDKEKHFDPIIVHAFLSREQEFLKISQMYSNIK